MIGYVLWLFAGVLLGIWLAPCVQAAKAAVARRLQQPDTQRDEASSFRDDDPTCR